jgi:WD40 repeat protein
VVLSRDTQWIAAALRYGTTIRLWRLNDRGQYERQADLPTWDGADWVTADFSPDSKMLATASRDGTVRLWDLPEEGALRAHTMPYDPLRLRGGVSGLALLNADRTLALATDGDSALEVWSLDEATPKLGRSTLLGKTIARSFAPISTASRFYSIWQNQVASWDIDKGLAKPAGVYPASDSPFALAISADEKRLAYVGKAGGLTCWDLTPTGHKPLPEIKGVTGPIRAPALSPEGKVLAAVSGTADKPILRMWDLGPTGAQERPPLAGFDGVPTALAFAPDGKSLAIGDGWTGKIALCEWTGDKPRIQVLQGAEGTRYHSLAFSPDGKLLLAGGEGPDSLASWSLATGKRSLWRFPGPVRTVAFAADGRHILCGNANGTTYVIRLAAAPTRK